MLIMTFIIRNCELALALDRKEYISCSLYAVYAFCWITMINTCVDPEGGRTLGPGPTLNNCKSIGFLNNTGPYPTENHKATKPTFNV